MDTPRQLPLLLALPLLATCGAVDRSIEEQQIETSDPVGLYRSAPGAELDGRLCITGGSAETRRFALATLWPDREACGGAGEVELAGQALQLKMDGDEPCEIIAQMQNLTLVFPQELPEDCNYYCSPNASLAGLRLGKVGDTQEAALTATDLVGDPLCKVGKSGEALVRPDGSGDPVAGGG